MNIDPATLDAGAVAQYEAKAHESTLTGFLLEIIPTTFVSALTEGSILQALFAAILFGLALSHAGRSEEHTSELQSLMSISYAVFCLKKKKTTRNKQTIHT